MDKALIGLAAGAALACASGCEDLNSCDIPEYQEIMARDQVLNQSVSTGAKYCDPYWEENQVLFCRVDRGLFPTLREYAPSTSLGFIVMYDGCREGVNAQALPGGYVVMNKDSLEAFSWASTAIAIKAENPSFNIDSYFRQIVNKANSRQTIPPPPGLETYSFSVDTQIMLYNAMVAGLYAHEMGHEALNHYDEMVCSMYSGNSTYYDYYAQQYGLAALSRENEFEADNYAVDFLVSNCTTDSEENRSCFFGGESADWTDMYVPEGILAIFKLQESMGGSENALSTHPSGPDRYANAKQRLAENGIDSTWLDEVF